MTDTKPTEDAISRTPQDILDELRDLHARVSKMPEVMVLWDISKGEMKPGHQAGATTSQILASLTNMIESVEKFAKQWPGHNVEAKHFQGDFWMMMVLAREGASRFEAGQPLDGKMPTYQ